MAPSKRKCPNGHQYDGNIYGDNCPFCPSPTQVSGDNAGGRTQVNPANDLGGGATIPASSGPTMPYGETPAGGGRTIIRAAGPATGFEGNDRRVAGVLVSFSHNPSGEVFKIYEGRNTIGRGQDNDIAIPQDQSMSGHHLVIVYREGDGRFLMEDQMTSNGTWLNGTFAGDRTEIKTNDVIVAGGTKFVFLAVPEGF